MFFRSLPAVTATLLFLAVNSIIANASDWKPSAKPGKKVTPAAFEAPSTGPEFEPVEAQFAPPLLPPPIPEGEESVSDPDRPADADNSAETPGSDDVPNFESGATSAASNEKTSTEDSRSIEVGKSSPDGDHSDKGKSQLKVLDGDEDAETLFDPKEWFGRWNESSLDWVLRNGDNGIGFLSIQGDTPSWNFDLDSEEEGLEIDFGTGIHFVDGPSHAGSDLPPRLFDLFWNTRFKAETDYGFGIDANFKMGLFTDFEDSVREGWRFPGRVLLYGDVWKSSHEIGRVVAGFEYLDLEQTEFLPAGGIIFEPNPDTKIDLYFPRPQIRFRTDHDEEDDSWLYFRGEYHGSAWAIERTAGNADVVSLTEYRATIGFETIPTDKEESTSFFEVGFLFNRDLEYRSGIGNFQPDDTVVLRWGSRY